MEFAGVDRQSGTVKNGGVENAGVDLSVRYGKGAPYGRKKRVQVSLTETVLYRDFVVCTPTQNRDHEINSNKQVLQVAVKLLHTHTRIQNN